MKYPLFIGLLFALLLAGAGGDRAEAGDKCLYGACGSSGRVGDRYTPNYGQRKGSWNDIYNQNNQHRYGSGIKAKPFDFGSSNDATRLPTTSKKRTGLNLDNPQARSEHVRWCSQRYRSYAAATDTYTTFDGRMRSCDSPFN